MAVGAALPYTPIASFLGFVPLPPIFWLWIASFLLVYAILTHLVKTWFARTQTRIARPASRAATAGGKLQ
jgi:Mg2+-importing ATPase